MLQYEDDAARAGVARAKARAALRKERAPLTDAQRSLIEADLG